MLSQTAGKMSYSTAKCQSPYPCSGDNPARSRHPESMSRMVNIAPGASSSCNDSLCNRINLGVFDTRKINYHPIIANSQPPGVMSATSDRKKQIVVSCKIYGSYHICHILAIDNHQWLFVYHPVMNFTGFIITLVISDQLLCPRRLSLNSLIVALVNMVLSI